MFRNYFNFSKKNNFLQTLNLDGRIKFQSNKKFLKGNKISNIECKWINDMLVNNKSIEILSLQSIIQWRLFNFFFLLGNEIGNLGVELISKGLEMNNSLKILNLNSKIFFLLFSNS